MCINTGNDFLLVKCVSIVQLHGTVHQLRLLPPAHTHTHTDGRWQPLHRDIHTHTHTRHDQPAYLYDFWKERMDTPARMNTESIRMATGVITVWQVFGMRLFMANVKAMPVI